MPGNTCDHAWLCMWRCRPFLLPCLSAAFISLMALLSSIFLLKETLPSKRAGNYERLQQQDEEQGAALPPLTTEGGRSGYTCCIRFCAKPVSDHRIVVSAVLVCSSCMKIKAQCCLPKSQKFSSCSLYRFDYKYCCCNCCCMVKIWICWEQDAALVIRSYMLHQLQQQYL